MAKKYTGVIDGSEFEMITGFEIEEEMTVPIKKIVVLSQKKSDKSIVPLLREWGGLYSVEEGMVTVENAKKSDKKNVSARVIRMFPTGMTLSEEKWYLEMERRKEEGLWDGELVYHMDENGNFAGGTAIVHAFEGIWVLAKDMDKVKRIYQ